MKDPAIPIYHGTRVFLGKKDLAISLYTKKCQFRCAFCGLTHNSSERDISVKDIKSQINWVFDQYEDDLGSFRQLSVGNEGSTLDYERFPKAAMNYLLDQSKKIPQLEVLSLETRPEYLRKDYLEDIQKKIHGGKIDVTVGLETIDDKLKRK